MPVKKTIKDLYQEIRKCLFGMIPEKWESIYLYASVIDIQDHKETGELYFYYFPKSIIKKNPINVYQIPQKFNLDEQEYLELTNRLYDLIKQLRFQNILYDKLNWSNITISIENVEFLVEYNCDNLLDSRYTDEDRMNIWQYKYLDFPIEKFSKKDRRKIKQYMQEELLGVHQVKTYVETYYQSYEHNNIEYNTNRKEDQYVKESSIDNNYYKKSNNEYKISTTKKYFNFSNNNLNNNIKVNKYQNNFNEDKKINSFNQLNNYKIKNNYINKNNNNIKDIEISNKDNQYRNNSADDGEIRIRNQILQYKD